MDHLHQRILAHQLCRDAGVAALPYGNAWWLLGNGVNRVVGEIAGLTPADFVRLPVAER